MLLARDPLAHTLNRVIGTDLDTPLAEDRTLVDIIGNEVDGAAGFRDAALQGHGGGGHRAREIGKQRRMNVDDPSSELAGEGMLQDGIVSRAYHQFHVVQSKCGRHGEVTRLAVREVGEPKHLARYPRLLCQLERRAVAVGADHHDSRRVHGILPRLDQRLEVAAPAGNQDANPEPTHSRIWTRRRSDATMSPTTKISPASRRRAVAALASSTTTIIPSPILNVRHISSSGVKGAR